MTRPDDSLSNELAALPSIDGSNSEAIRERAHELLAAQPGEPAWRQWLNRAEPIVWIAASAVYLLWAATASFAIHQ